MRSLTGFDIIPAAVARAQALADEGSPGPTFRYHAVDLNRFDLPTRAFDFVDVFQSLTISKRWIMYSTACERR